MKDLLKKGLGELKLDYAEETLEQLEAFYRYYTEANEKFNLSSLVSQDDFVVKHILDSAAGISAFGEEPGVVGDIGSGGGFPGMVLGILKPHWKLHLLEVTQKKVDYLKTTAEALGVELTVWNPSSEKVGKIIDSMTCRAFAAFPKILKQSRKYLRPQGRIVAYKGRMQTIEKEMAGLPKNRIEILPVKVPFLESERHMVIWDTSKKQS